MRTRSLWILALFVAFLWFKAVDQMDSNKLLPKGFELGILTKFSAVDFSTLNHACHLSAWRIANGTKVQIRDNHEEFLDGLEEGFLDQFSNRRRPKSAVWKLVEDVRIVDYILARDMQCHVGSFQFPIGKLNRISNAETTIIALDHFERGEGLAFLILPKEGYIVRLSIWYH